MLLLDDDDCKIDDVLLDSLMAAESDVLRSTVTADLQLE